MTKPNPRYALLSQKHVIAEPRTVREALQNEGWLKAMKEELAALEKNHTWTLVPQENNMNVIGVKWVFKTKYKADNSLDKLKARLVAKGFNQEEGIDFLETFSPVIKPVTMRLILTIATVKKWRVHQLDVKNAFLNGVLSETVFVHQPPGFKSRKYPNHVCQLHKALYGLKQAPRAWFERFSTFLLAKGFFSSTADPSLFIKHSGHQVLVLILYVDDMLVTGSSSAMLMEFIATLKAEFAMTDLGLVHYFLGIEITRTNTGLFLSQQ